MIEILCHAEPDAVVLEIVGPVHESAAAMLQSCIQAATEAGLPRVVLDLRRVTRLDPLALAALATCMQVLEGETGCTLELHGAGLATT